MTIARMTPLVRWVKKTQIIYLHLFLANQNIFKPTILYSAIGQFCMCIYGYNNSYNVFTGDRILFLEAIGSYRNKELNSINGVLNLDKEFKLEYENGS